MASYTGGLTVTKEMWDILKQPGYLSTAKRGLRLRELYVNQSLSFDATKLSDFGLACYFGVPDQIEEQVESGTAPDLEGTETPFRFGYATLIVAGSQRVTAGPPTGLRHLEALKYLISRGVPVDIGDIAGFTALHHAITGQILKLDLARALLEAGAEVNHQNRYGEVALYGAFQRNHILGIDLLMSFGASLDIKEGDGGTPMTFFLSCGPQVIATVSKWIKKRNGEEAPRMEKRCDCCGRNDTLLKNCAKCQVARYCSVECQKTSWPSHKKTCQPFSPNNTVTLKPHYEAYGQIFPTPNITRNLCGISTEPVPDSHLRAAHIPKGLSSESKNLIIKVQMPFNLCSAQNNGNLLIYTKKRDLVCGIWRSDSPADYDRISRVVRAKGVRGAKAYFAAELKSKDELVVKISEVLAEQPF